MKHTAAGPRRHWREGALVLALLAVLAACMSRPRMAQDPAYHEFADQRQLLGLPHLLDVASNLPFLVIGVLGLLLCRASGRAPRARAWTAVFAGTALVSAGSAYYHWAPDDARLVWDRLPMTLGFMGLFVALVAEHLGEQVERRLLLPALLTGLASVLWWRWSGDLRFYFWVQFAPLVCVPLVLLLYPGRYTHRAYLLHALGFYVLAKLAEAADRSIFELTARTVSGHTLKHLLAAVNLQCVR
jgi:hypothetical protein